MTDRSLFGTLTRQQRMAVKLRASEKRILFLTVKAMDEELSKLSVVTKKKDVVYMTLSCRNFDTLQDTPRLETTRSPRDSIEDRLLSDESGENVNLSSTEEKTSIERRKRR